MACFNPNFAYIGTMDYPDPDGKPIRKVMFISRYEYEHFRDHPFEHVNKATGEIIKAFPLPCGRCAGCQVDASRQWAGRMVCEQLDSFRPCWFLTLTYEDHYLPYGLQWYRPEPGLSELIEVPTTRRKDLDDFMDRLRMEYFNKYRETGIRFYGTTEYGSTTHRPHIHVIVFNLDIRDLDVVGKSYSGDIYYCSKTLEKLWGKGFVAVGTCEYKSAAYVARYCVKKRSQKVIPRLSETIEGERAGMSRRPGIGAEFAKSNFKKIYTASDDLLIYDHHDLNGVTDRLVLPGGACQSPPRYFDKLYAKEGDIEAYNLALIKLAREDRARRSLLVKLAHSNYSEEQLLKIEAEKASQSYSLLIRALDASL